MGIAPAEVTQADPLALAAGVADPLAQADIMTVADPEPEPLPLTDEEALALALQLSTLPDSASPWAMYAPQPALEDIERPMAITDIPRANVRRPTTEGPWANFVPGPEVRWPIDPHRQGNGPGPIWIARRRWEPGFKVVMGDTPGQYTADDVVALVVRHVIGVGEPG